MNNHPSDNWQNPWGKKGGDQDPSEDVLAKIKSQFKNNFSNFNNDGSNNKKMMGIIGGILALWLFSGFYRVEPDELGVVLRFGAWVRNEQPGLNYHLPYPIETVVTPKVTVVNRIDSGFKLSNKMAPKKILDKISGLGIDKVNLQSDGIEDSYMLTGDKNILDITFSVLWVIKDVEKYLFNTRSPEAVVKMAAESAVREIIAQSPITSTLTDGRANINIKSQELLQNMLDNYETGIQILQVELQDVNPPPQVIDAFRDVQSASADQERAKNIALAYEKDILPKARGEAEKILNDAEAYKQEKVAKAEGEAQRFLMIWEEFKKAPEITKKWMYIDTIEKILQESEIILVDGDVSKGILPHLNLSEKRKDLRISFAKDPKASAGKNDEIIEEDK